MIKKIIGLLLVFLMILMFAHSTEEPVQACFNQPGDTTPNPPVCS